jgi:hypothetical protein
MTNSAEHTKIITNPILVLEWAMGFPRSDNPAQAFVHHLLGDAPATTLDLEMQFASAWTVVAGLCTLIDSLHDADGRVGLCLRSSLQTGTFRMGVNQEQFAADLKAKLAEPIARNFVPELNRRYKPFSEVHATALLDSASRLSEKLDQVSSDETPVVRALSAHLDQVLIPQIRRSIAAGFWIPSEMVLAETYGRFFALGIHLSLDGASAELLAFVSVLLGVLGCVGPFGTASATASLWLASGGAEAIVGEMQNAAQRVGTRLLGLGPGPTS